jgi:aspartyl-tRNA(Asn)/glutamyl-tRNA(Gln) amidotransferase subunit C
MSVGEQDVRHVANLARLGLDPERVEHLVRELSAILEHMDVLNQVDTSRVDAVPDESPALPTRSDGGNRLTLEDSPEAFAPEWQDGFFLVPRLATHETDGES